MTVEGHHDGAAADVRAALEDLADLLGRHARPASLHSAILGPGKPSFDADTA